MRCFTSKPQAPRPSSKQTSSAITCTAHQLRTQKNHQLYIQKHDYNPNTNLLSTTWSFSSLLKHREYLKPYHTNRNGTEQNRTAIWRTHEEKHPVATLYGMIKFIFSNRRQMRHSTFQIYVSHQRPLSMRVVPWLVQTCEGLRQVRSIRPPCLLRLLQLGLVLSCLVCIPYQLDLNSPHAIHS